MELFKIKDREIHTDYNIRDWTKFVAVTTLSVGILVYGLIFYLETFLIPGMEGFALNLEITSNWVVAEAENHVEEIMANAQNEEPSVIVQELLSKQDLISNTSNSIFISWIAMAMGLLVPIWIVWKFHKFVNYIGRKYFSVEEGKKMLYTIDRR